MLKNSNHPAESSIRLIAKNLVEKKKKSRLYVGVDMGSPDGDYCCWMEKRPDGTMKVISVSKLIEVV